MRRLARFGIIIFMALALVPAHPAAAGFSSSPLAVQSAPITFSGHVWLGSPPATGPGVPSAVVLLYEGLGCDNIGDALAVAETSGDGSFILEAEVSTAAFYLIVEVNPPGYTSTGAAGSTEWITCDADVLQSVDELVPGDYSGLNFWDSGGPTATPTNTPTRTPTPTFTPTNTPTRTPTPTSTPTGSATLTNTPTGAPTPTVTPTVTSTPTATRTRTPTSTPTGVTTSTNTPTGAPTPTVTPTVTSTPTATRTRTPTPTPTGSTTLTNTPTGAPTPTATATHTPTRTATASVAPSVTQTPTNTPTRVPPTLTATRDTERTDPPTAPPTAPPLIALVTPAQITSPTPTTLPRATVTRTPRATERTALTATAAARRTAIAATATAVVRLTVQASSTAATAAAATAAAASAAAASATSIAQATQTADAAGATATALAIRAEETARAAAAQPDATRSAAAPEGQAAPGSRSPASAAGVGPVLINEVNAAGPASYSPEEGPEPVAPTVLIAHQWIELYNRTAEPVTLRGWSVENATGRDALPDMTIPAYGYALLVADEAHFRQQYPTLLALIVELPGQDVGGPGGLDPTPNSDHLVLRDQDGTVMDAMSWGSDTVAFAPACPAVVAGHSLEREPVGRDSDSAADFVDRAPPSPGGWQAPAAWVAVDRRLPAQEQTRDLFFASAPTPLEVAKTPLSVLLTSLLLAILMALVFGTCATVLDNTVREQETTLGNLIRRLPVLGPALEGVGEILNNATSLQRLGALPMLVIVLVVYALLFCLLDASWRPLAPGGLFLFASMFVASAIVGFTDTLAQGLWVRKQGARPGMQFWPFNFFVAGGAVAFSRIVPLQPGLIFGAPGGLHYGEFEPTEREERQLLGIGLLSLVALGGAAWAASWAANQASLALAAAEVATWPEWLAGLRNLLLLLFLASLQVVFFQMIPIANTYGRKVMQVSKLTWLILFIPIGWLLARVLLNPNSAFLEVFLESAVRALLIFLGGLVLFTTFVYLYFQRRARD